MADMIKDAMAAADNHLKVAHNNHIKAQTWLDILGAGHNPEPRPQSGLTGVWMCLALFISLIVLAQFLRRRNFDVASGGLMSKCLHKMDNCLRPAYANLTESSSTLITHVDRTSARFVQWKTFALCSMLFVVSVSAVYHIMVTPVFGVTGVWTGLIIFMSLIGTAGLLRLPQPQRPRQPEQPQQPQQPQPEQSEQPEQPQQPEEPQQPQQPEQPQLPEQPVPQQPQEPEQPVPQPPSKVFTKEDMTTEIRNSIKKLLSSKESLKLTKLDKINENEVEDIRDAIKAVRSIEEYLTLWKSLKDNYGEHENKIQYALKPAIDAVQSIEEIINSGI